MSNDIDLAPLAPMAQGMVFETLRAGRARPYFEQITMELEGIDPMLFRRALEETIAASPNLLASIEHEDLDAPVAVIRRGVALPWVEEDWSGAAAGRLEAYLAADRARGFELTHPPLIRALLAREGDGLWRFVLSYHHLLMDGWSGALLFDELDERYAALREGRAPRLEPRPPYTDFLAWLEARDLGAAERYWRGQLSHAPATGVPLGLAAKPGAQAGRIVERRARVDAEAWAAACSLARRLGVTPAVVAAGAWSLCLSRAHGEADVLFGATIAGRPAELPGSDRMIGLFINTAPIRTQPSESRGLEEFLRDLQQTMLEAREHGHAPLARILGWAAPERAAFETLFVYENYPPAAAAARARLGVKTAQNREESSYPAALILEPEADGGLAACLAYDETRLDGQGAALLLERYFRLLAAMAEAGAETPLGLIDHRTGRDLAVQAALRAETGDQPCPPLLPELFLEQAARTPDRPALVWQDQSISYAALAARATAVAAAIAQRARRPNPVVAIAMEQSADFQVALVAVLLSGGASFTIDQSSPKARLLEAMRVVRPDLLLTDRSVDLPDELGPALSFDDLAATQGGALPEVDPEALAYVILTSGSTGTPKPVGVRHRALAFLAKMHRGAGEAGRRHAAVLKPQFDASWIPLLETLICGGVLHVPGPNKDLELTLATAGATDAALTPSLLGLLTPEALPKLRRIRIGGETPPAELVEAWGNRVELINSYGPTETAIFVTEERLRPGQPITMGGPLPHVSAYVLSPALRPVGVGEAGELYIGGPALAQGYLGMPGLTARAFPPDPFGPPGSRMYRTGDVVRVEPDGRLVFLGRRDGQVKLRGLRIELGDVESALYAAGLGVDEAAAVVVPGAGGRPRLVACVTRRVDRAALEAVLAERLPAAFRPQEIVQIEALPLTWSGKLDRRALAAEAACRLGQMSTGDAEFRDETERAIAAAFAGALGVGQIGPEDDFFALGGDSIVSLQAAAMARKSGVNLSPGLIVTHRTPRAIAEMTCRPLAPGGLALLGEGAGRAVVLVGGAGGGPETMVSVARGLSGHRVLAFEPDPADETIDELAVSLVERIEAAGLGERPVLVGHSFGAYVALEAVRRLEALGRSPSLVVLDATAPLPQRPRSGRGDDETLYRTLAEIVAEVTGRSAPTGGICRDDLLDLLAQAGLARDEADADQLIAQSRGHWVANASYVAEPIDLSSMLLVRARERGEPLRGFEPLDMPGADWGWSTLVHGHVTTATSPGNHVSMLRGDLGVELGAMIRVYLHFECAADNEEVSVDAG